MRITNWLSEAELDEIRNLKVDPNFHRDCVLWVIFSQICTQTTALGQVPTELLLDHIEALCAEGRRVLATSARQSSGRALAPS